MERFLAFLVIFSISGAWAQSPTIAGYEYWFNQDDLDRVYVPVAPATTVNIQSVPLNASALPPGVHQAHLRLKDIGPGAVARWSSIVTRTLQKHHDAPYEIVALRYWAGTPSHDTVPGIRYKWFDAPQQDLSYTGPLDLCGYPTGNQMLKLQLMDNHGQWSTVVMRSVNIVTEGTLLAPTITTLPAQPSYCPGDVVVFVATQPVGSANPASYSWNIPGDWSHQPSTGNTISVTIGDSPGNVEVFGTSYCGTTATTSFSVVIPTSPSQPSMIQPVATCAGSQTIFSVQQVPDLTYEWDVLGGEPATGGPGDEFVTMLNETATITVTPYNSCNVPGPAQSANITVTQPPDPGTNGSIALCATDSPVALLDHLGGNPETTGTWEGPSTTDGTFIPGTHGPGDYTYTVPGSAACPSATATVTVSVHDAPHAGTDGMLTICSADDPVDLFTHVEGSPQSGGSWIGPSMLSDGMFDPAAHVPGTYSYIVTGTPPCAADTAEIGIFLEAPPYAGTDATMTLCSSDTTPASLFDALGGVAQAGGHWSPDAPEGMYQPATMEPGAYLYTVQGTVCADASALVTVTEVQQPGITGITAPSSALVGQTVTFAIDMVAGATYLWTLPDGWEGSSTTHTIEVTMGGPAYVTDSVHVQVVVEPCDTVEAWVPVLVDGTVGILTPTAEHALTIFPNPSSGVFTLIPSTEGVVEYRVLNALGQLVRPAITHSGPFTLDLSNLAAGSYLLRWSSTGANGQRSLLIQH